MSCHHFVSPVEMIYSEDPSVPYPKKSKENRESKW